MESDTPTPTTAKTSQAGSSSANPMIFRKPTLRVPEREKGHTQSPLKFSAVERTRRHRESEPAEPPAEPLAEPLAEPQAEPPADAHTPPPGHAHLPTPQLPIPQLPTPQLPMPQLPTSEFLFSVPPNSATAACSQQLDT